jgi:hypothetical protein
MKIILFAAGVLLAAGPAMGEPDQAAKDAFAARLFAGATTEKTQVCFTRRYDAAHLARLPRQQTTAMRLLVTAEPGTEGEGTSYMFRLGVTLRDTAGRFESGGGCGLHATETGTAITFGCGVDCDGGGISVEMARDDAAVLVKIDSVRIWKPGVDDDNEESRSLGGGDDRIFRLDRAALSECASLVDDMAERAAMLTWK